MVERNNRSAIVAILSTAGVPIASIPDEKKGNVFSMLVYSLLSVSPTSPYTPSVMEVEDRKLYLLAGKKAVFAMLADSLDDLRDRIFEMAEDLLYSLDKLIVDEGIIDQELQEKAKAKLIEGLKMLGIDVAKFRYLYRKVVGDMYRVVTEITNDGSKLHSYFRIAYFPRLLDSSLINREENIRIRRLLELCDGNYSLEYIGKVLGFTRAQLYRYIAYYIRQKKMILEMGFELIA